MDLRSCRATVKHSILRSRSYRPNHTMEPTPPGLFMSLFVIIFHLQSAAALAAWQALAFTHQREHVEAIEGAKKPETRARRIEKALAFLAARPARKAPAKTIAKKR